MLGPVKALVATDPVAEMRVLERMIWPRWETRARSGAAAGTVGIVSRMSEAFEAAGVLEMMSRELDMREFTERARSVPRGLWFSDW